MRKYTPQQAANQSRKQGRPIGFTHNGESFYTVHVPENGGASPVPVVNVTTLTQVISEWGREITQPLVTKNPGATPVEPPQPPVDNFIPLDPQNFSATTTPIIFTNRSVTTAGSAFKAGNASPLDRLEFHNVKVRTMNGAPPDEGYGLYIGAGCERLIFDRFDCLLARNDNDYCYRGNARHIESNDSRFVNSGLNKSCFRAYGVLSMISRRDLFKGDEMHLGGPPGSPGPHDVFNGEFEDGKISCTKVEVFSKSKVKCTRMDFTGTGHITNHLGAVSSYHGCTKDGRPLRISDFHQNDGLDGVTIT